MVYDGYLRLINITKRFKGITVLDSLSLSVGKGEILGILGPSGCGKTTLLKVILGVLTIDEGDILLSDNSIKEVAINNRNFGYIPQSLSLFPHLTVYENVAFGLQVRKLPKNDIVDRVDHLLELAGIKELADKKPHQLSGGQKQRVSLLRALAMKPEVLLLDEPLSSLDINLARQLRWELRRLIKESKATAIFVSHNPEEVTTICDRIAIMIDGKIIQIGTIDEILACPQSLTALKVIGLENLFSIKQVKFTRDEKLLVETDIGRFETFWTESKKSSKGIYIPTEAIKIEERFPSKVQDEKFVVPVTFQGYSWFAGRKKISFVTKDGSLIIVEDNGSLKVRPQEQSFLLIDSSAIVFY